MQTTLSTNTSTAWQSDHAGTVFLQAVGTFGSGTLTVEVQLEDGSTTQAVQDGSFTSGPVSKIIEIPRHMPVRRSDRLGAGRRRNSQHLVMILVPIGEHGDAALGCRKVGGHTARPRQYKAQARVGTHGRPILLSLNELQQPKRNARRTQSAHSAGDFFNC